MAAHPDQVFQRAFASLQAGQVAEAERAFKKLLRTHPRHVGALNLLGIVTMQLGRFAEAEDYLRRAIKENSKSDVTLYNYGLVLKSLGWPAEAAEQFGRALAINPRVPETWNNRGVVFNDLKRYQDAIADFDKALSINANYADALANKAKALGGLQLYDQALAAYDKALTLKPALTQAWIGRGNLHSKLGHYADALTAFDKALAIKPDLAEAWLGRGNLLYHLNRYDDAGAAYDNAIALMPNLAGAWAGRGNVLSILFRYDEALAAFDKAVALDPGLAEAWAGRGNIFVRVRRHADAVAAYGKALAINPDLEYVEGDRLHAKQLICDWTDLAAKTAHLLPALREGKAASVPFPLLSLESSPANQLQCAKLWVAKKYPPVGTPIWRGERYKHDRIRVAYLSRDFREHPVIFLMAGMFECHDKSRFETTAISWGPGDNSAIRNRVKNSFDRFIDVDAEKDTKVAELIRDMEIDIVVDLMGFTTESRTMILAWKPAPIQVNFLGFPGTMGAPYIDYIIADRTVIAEDQRAFYSEDVVYLPDCFQPTDQERVIADKHFTRAEAGLPQDGFVFCSFNANYKITPAVYDLWMRILKRVEGSVLWLFAESELARENLQREAAARGVDRDRLIFAPRIPLPEHQARLRLADLFLDTSPYSAGATASDTLWVGVPLVTLLGKTFVGRMAASVLQSIGLPELIAPTPEAYEALAIDLATNAGRLAEVKQKLAENRLTAPLFDTKLYTKHLEVAYAEIVQREQARNA